MILVRIGKNDSKRTVRPKNHSLNAKNNLLSTNTYFIQMDEIIKKRISCQSFYKVSTTKITLADRLGKPTSAYTLLILFSKVFIKMLHNLVNITVDHDFETI